MQNLISFNDILKCTRRAIEIHFPFGHILEKWDSNFKNGELVGKSKVLITNLHDLSAVLNAFGVKDSKEFLIVATATKLAFDKAAEFNA